MNCFKLVEIAGCKETVLRNKKQAFVGNCSVCGTEIIKKHQGREQKIERTLQKEKIEKAQKVYLKNKERIKENKKIVEKIKKKKKEKEKIKDKDNGKMYI